MDAVDPARPEETEELIKDEERGEGSRRRRWSEDGYDDDDDGDVDRSGMLSPGDSDDGASMMTGVSKVKAAQAVW